MTKDLSIVVINDLAESVYHLNEFGGLGLFNSGLVGIHKVTQGIYRSDSLTPVWRAEFGQDLSKILHNLRVHWFWNHVVFLERIWICSSVEALRTICSCHYGAANTSRSLRVGVLWYVEVRRLSELSESVASWCYGLLRIVSSELPCTSWVKRTCSHTWAIPSAACVTYRIKVVFVYNLSNLLKLLLIRHTPNQDCFKFSLRPESILQG